MLHICKCQTGSYGSFISVGRLRQLHLFSWLSHKKCHRPPCPLIWGWWLSSSVRAIFSAHLPWKMGGAWSSLQWGTQSLSSFEMATNHVLIWWANLCPGILIMNALQCSKYSGMSWANLAWCYCILWCVDPWPLPSCWHSAVLAVTRAVGVPAQQQRGVDGVLAQLNCLKCQWLAGAGEKKNSPLLSDVKNTRQKVNHDICVLC